MSDAAVTAGSRPVGWWACGVGLLVAVAAGCSAPSGPPAPAPEVAPPPAPPAACLLDTAGLTSTTGLGWTPDQTTASDTRCVYDPAAPNPPAAGSGSTAAEPSAAEPTGAQPAAANSFLAVEIAPVTATDAGAELDVVAAACADGSRTPIADGGAGFVCRFRGGSVFAAIVRAGKVVTVSVSEIPEGTTAARLVVALQQQLDTLGR